MDKSLLMVTILDFVSMLSPIFYVYIVRGTVAKLWPMLRILLFTSLVLYTVNALAIGEFDEEVLAMTTLAIAAAYLVSGIYLRMSSIPAPLGLDGYVITIRVLRRRHGIVAFSFTGDSSIYVTEDLIRSLPARELLAIVAHEIGHVFSLRPLTPLLANLVIIYDTAVLVTGVFDTVAKGFLQLMVGFSAIAASWTLWVIYNWSWETLADLYSLAKTGTAAYTTLQRITAATPRPITIREAYRELLYSLRPRRVKASLFFANPHPSPATRLYIMQQALKKHEALLG